MAFICMHHQTVTPAVLRKGVAAAQSVRQRSPSVMACFACVCVSLQVDIYEFEKTELNSQEEMEKQARLYAEEQLQEAKMALQCERQAKAELQGQVKAKMQEFAELLQEATQKHEQEKERALALQQQLEQVRHHRMLGAGLLVLVCTLELQRLPAACCTLSNTHLVRHDAGSGILKPTDSL